MGAAAAAWTAASLIAHGLLVAVVLRDPSPDVPAPIRVIPVEVVMEPPAAENQRATASPRDNSKRPPEAIQNRPERTGDFGQKQAPPLGLDSAVKPAAPAISGARDLEPAKESQGAFAHEKILHAESQMETAVPDHFRAVAVPLPSESGGEAMSYRFIVGGMLERVKHYPGHALQRGAKGTATIGFVLDGSGGVASVVLLRSSGEAELDAESVALVCRAAPFPAPPPACNIPLRSKSLLGWGISPTFLGALRRAIANTIIPADRMINTQAFSVFDVLRDNPGVLLKQGHGPRDIEISIRGSNAKNGFGIRNNAVFEDDFPVTQPDSLSCTDITESKVWPRYRGFNLARRGATALEIGSVASEMPFGDRLEIDGRSKPKISEGSRQC